MEKYCYNKRASMIDVGIKNLSGLLKYKLLKKYPSFYTEQNPKWLHLNFPRNKEFPDIKNFGRVHNLLPGKYHHIMNIIRAYISGQIYQTKSCSPFFYPYLSDPIVKYALSIPTQDLFSKHYDRIIQRESISKYFNTDKVWRQIKGGTTGHFLKSCNKNLDFILEVCTKGYFAKNQLIDVKQLKESIMLMANGYNSGDKFALMRLYSVELFLLNWLNFKQFSHHGLPD